MRLLLRSTSLRHAPRSIPPPRLRLHRFYATESHGEGETHTFAPEGFHSSAWIYSVVLSILGYGAYHYSDAVSTHLSFLTSVFSRNTDTSSEDAVNEARLRKAEEKTEDMFVYGMMERPKMFKLRSIELVDRASPFGVGVGTQVDMSPVREKYGR